MLAYWNDRAGSVEFYTNSTICQRNDLTKTQGDHVPQLEIWKGTALIWIPYHLLSIIWRCTTSLASFGKRSSFWSRWVTLPGHPQKDSCRRFRQFFQFLKTKDDFRITQSGMWKWDLFAQGLGGVWHEKDDRVGYTSQQTYFIGDEAYLMQRRAGIGLSCSSGVHGFFLSDRWVVVCCYSTQGLTWRINWFSRLGTPRVAVEYLSLTWHNKQWLLSRHRSYWHAWPSGKLLCDQIIELAWMDRWQFRADFIMKHRKSYSRCRSDYCTIPVL